MKSLFFAGILCMTAQLNYAQSFDKQAHRGGKSLYPENTIPAMKNALKMGITTLEMDLAITKDRKVILSHDAFLSPELVTKPNGKYIPRDSGFYYKIYDMPYAKIQTYDVGMKKLERYPDQKKMKAQKPLFSAVIDSCESYARELKRPLPFYNIETKTRPFSDNVFHPEPKEFTDLMMKIILEKGIQDRVIIQSFDPRTLEIIHKKYPKIMTALLVEKVDDQKIAQQRTNFQNIPVEKFKQYPNHLNSVKGDMSFLSFTPTIYSPDQSLVTPELVKECHALGMKVIPWTVNSKERLQELQKMGIDGLISDDPQIFE
ncbi:glycerophosphodiester phosphodiesterase [Elizabethkingia anophelis]|uniref:Glycerophosphodiester phosphodiesterase n=1 Tax=Elizabethkingia anophelis TaxID=1117645 RepID=A0AAE4T0J3_9FLAO|nr:glycerophosphodiester phosphodiesterase [Elizabethkingia anophelis]MCT3918709.1 glycerophosphodiester phosphodiesterase [Elizabethkingia anophelis]MCT3951063.1 glycerophosphodiester phosphodiesterase [Elizabethkingia anophelis]MCT3954606.1 glycerophosphodiester phosphodiesterase [Elizabethkingia anophelis]MCT3986322.1 glycerophosphodiester phosphodiesterase [Elizabethkingia anophelis]